MTAAMIWTTLMRRADTSCGLNRTPLATPPEVLMSVALRAGEPDYCECPFPWLPEIVLPEIGMLSLFIVRTALRPA